MHFETSWRADGLRWIASLFTGAADFIERNAASPCESQHAAPDTVDDVRARISARYF